VDLARSSVIASEQFNAIDRTCWTAIHGPIEFPDGSFVLVDHSFAPAYVTVLHCRWSKDRRTAPEVADTPRCVGIFTD